MAVVKPRCRHVRHVAETLVEEYAKVQVQRPLVIKVVPAQTPAGTTLNQERTSRWSALKITDNPPSPAMQSLVVALLSILESAMPKLTYPADHGK